MEELALKQWNRNIKLPTAVICTAKRNVGKTYYSKFLLYLLCDEIDELYIICPTLRPRDWEDLTVPEHIFRDYSGTIIQDIIDKQIIQRDADKEMKQIVILLDDCVYSMKKTDPILETLYVKGRHYNITPIVLTQKFRLLSNAIRSNSDYCFCGKVVNLKEKETIYQEFNNGDSKKEFFNMMDIVTADRGILVIDNSTTEKEMFYKDKAPDPMPRFYVEEAVKQKMDRIKKEVGKKREKK